MDTETTIRAYQSGHKSGTSNAILYKFLADAQRRLRQLETRVTEADDPEDAAYAAGLADAYRARVAELTPPDHCPHGNPEHDHCPICDETVDIEVKRIEDEYPDLSWLEQDCMQPEGSERLASYGDDWHMIGIRAECEVVVNGVIQTITSGGLWGIESDSDEDYLKSVEDEQIDELRGILAELGIFKRQEVTA